MDMGWIQPTAPSASGENRCRATNAPSTASAFFASWIAASPLRHNALSSDPKRPHCCGRPAPPTATRPRSFFSAVSAHAPPPPVAGPPYSHDRTLTEQRHSESENTTAPDGVPDARQQRRYEHRTDVREVRSRM